MLSTMHIKNFVIDRNKEQTAEFRNPAAQADRRLYRAQHPTEILVTKCMDGRLNLALYTQTPPGILQPFRNIGGRFDLGWPFFQEVISEAVGYAIGKGREVVCITSYHFSHGDHHRGCAGFGYDTDGAHKAADILRGQFNRVFGDTNQRPIYTLTIGIETDEEALTFHGSTGAVLEVAKLPLTTTEAEVTKSLHELYPDMRTSMIRDLVPLVMGNIAHINELRIAGREPIDLEHREQIIAVGRGFDWLHIPNKALIIGPYSHEWPSIVARAGGIILGNLKEERIPADQGILLLLGAFYREEEGASGWRLKEEKVRYLRKTAEEALREGVPELVPHLSILSGVTHADTREFRLVE